MTTLIVGLKGGKYYCLLFQTLREKNLHADIVTCQNKETDFWKR